MITKIVFFIENRFNKRDYSRFGIDLLKNNGFKVEVWDATLALWPENNHHPLFHSEEVIIFNDRKILLKRLLSLTKDDFVVNLVLYAHRNLDVYRTLSKSGADYAVFMSNATPTVLRNKVASSLMKRIKKIYPPLPRRIWRLLSAKLPFRWLGIKPARLILAGGRRCLTYNYPKTRNTEILWCHTLDYDLYLKERDKPAPTRPIAVFIDQIIPGHPDRIVKFKLEPVMTADRYYPMLNGFFDKLEKESQLRVIIAAHPRADEKKYAKYFNNRECVKNRTIELVKECSLVLTHFSTAINFANLFNKPMTFLTSSEFDRIFENDPAAISRGDIIKSMASWFGKEPVYIDKPVKIDWEKELLVSKDHYSAYREAYIKTGDSADLPYWQIVANRLKKGLN